MDKLDQAIVFNAYVHQMVLTIIVLLDKHLKDVQVPTKVLFELEEFLERVEKTDIFDFDYHQKAALKDHVEHFRSLMSRNFLV